MEIIAILFQQILLMFCLIVVGYFLRLKNIFSMATVKDISTFLLCICNPAVMMTAFDVEFEMEIVKGIMISFAICILLHLVMILIDKIFLKKESGIIKFAAIFSNTSFMGIPLVSSLLPSEAIIYLTTYIVTSTVFMWTYGIHTLSGDEKISVKKILFNPASIALMLGIVIMILPFDIPVILDDTLDLITSLNTPLAMIVLGAYLFEGKISDIFISKPAYKASFYRLIVMPLVSLSILFIVPFDQTILKLTLLIAASTPAPIALSMFAQMYDGDYIGGAKIISLSTILSLFSIPLLVFLANLVWQTI